MCAPTACRSTSRSTVRSGDSPTILGRIAHFTREPLIDEVDVAIVGAGFGGLLTGARLRELGVQQPAPDRQGRRRRRHLVLEPLSGNRLRRRVLRLHAAARGARLRPLREVRQGGGDLRALPRIAEHYDLYRDACLQTEVHEIRWDSDDSRWIISTNRGDEMRARFVSMANGYLQRPKLPGIPGIEIVRRPHVPHQPVGLRLHRQRTWSDLADKRVGIIGTGATAVQCVPHLAAAAQASVGVPAHAVDRSTFAATDRPIRSGPRASSRGGSAGASRTSRSSPPEARPTRIWWPTRGPASPEAAGRASDAVPPDTESWRDFAKMEEIRARVDAIVDDPATAEALKPWYGYFCKRPCFHDEYLQTFNRANVDPGRHPRTWRASASPRPASSSTATEHPSSTASSSRRDSRWAPTTAGAQASRSSAATVVTLTDDVARRCAHASRCLTSADSRTASSLSIAQSGLHGELPVSARRPGDPRRVAHRAGTRTRRRPRSRRLPHAEAAWVDTVMQRSTGSVDRAKSCTPGYYNREGEYDAKTRQGSFFFGGPTEYAETLQAWRDADDFDGLEIRRSAIPRRRRG